MSADQYNGPNSPLRAACWLYHRTGTPERFQNRVYPPAALPDAFKIPSDALEQSALGAVPCSFDDIASYSFDDGSGASRSSGPLSARWSKDGRAIAVLYEERPLALFDGENCYHRHVKEVGRWGQPWSDEKYSELFATGVR